MPRVAAFTWRRTRWMPGCSAPIPTPMSCCRDGCLSAGAAPHAPPDPVPIPAIGLFDTVATAADLEAVMELAGWTNDRLVAERIARLPQAEWVYGRANASIVMAAFLHVGPEGGRFNGTGAGGVVRVGRARSPRRSRWRTTCGARRWRGGGSDGAAVPAILGAFARGISRYSRPQGAMAAVYAPDSYAASQVLGEQIRAGGRRGFCMTACAMRAA